MAKLTLTPIANLQNETTVVGIMNDNWDLIETAVERTLSRDGTSPNQMTDELDMNSNQIINLPAPSTNNSPVRLGDLEDMAFPDGIGVPAGGASGYILTKTSGADYAIAWLPSASAYTEIYKFQNFA